MYGKILKANIISAEGICSTSFSKSRFKKDDFLFQDLLLSKAILNDSGSLSIPMNSHSFETKSFSKSSHNPVAHPKSTIFLGLYSDILFTKAVRSLSLAK